ncbi:MAG: Rne/Rng family ribonuclease [Candidatus Omnitrophica bacterium]|nr:Rne/Rng family ribonuclease [Candidatus Omnitrophota bacterium]MBU1928408.1 Rne/Rng family ribonuclease [Candidatus Omnitrophota bacterium]MBU2034290.1 Rne/Rng family ribonuclease [Candidatus Omnitrophota bacterium]MBU2221156.1 Rne/Rng family ribonuclease [Candidatus Omnitrophota bacterium]MBU2257522.1 Rne/Rng family ribonuclease [Candidatus Omnitrophota bacterium]
MAREILINADPRERRVAVVDDGRMEEFYIERPQDKTIVGNIYKGKIEAIIQSIGGAFVDIGLPKNGFLYLSEIENAFETLDTPHSKPREVKKGEEVLVQVVKESFGTKGPRLSSEIGIAGRYLVLMPLNAQSGVSRRIEDDVERKRLRQILAELKFPKGISFIVRTAACGRSKQELWKDASFLIKTWARLEKIAKRQKAPSLVYEEYDLVLRAVRDSFGADVSKLVVDSKADYYRIVNFIRTFERQLSRKVEFYRGDDLFEDKDVERQILRTFENKVYLKSKAYIIIEPTEGLVVIDVNSGGFKRNLGQEDMAFKVNCEAAVEAAHQLKLRDLGGIIVIDFIDMERESHRREVLNTLKNALSTDRAKYDILGISKFGVVEMTRERIHNTVASLSYQTCPYCQGRAKVKSPVTMSIYALKELKRYLKIKPTREVNLSLNPAVITEISKDNQSALRFVERRFRTRVNLVSNPALHMEDVNIS